MATFDLILAQLNRGQSVRRENWPPDVKMFVQGNSLMYKYGSSKPWQCALSWDEIAATDWFFLKETPFARQVLQVSTESRPLLLVEELALPRSFDQVRSHFNLQSISLPSKTGRSPG